MLYSFSIRITGPRILYFPSDRSRQHTQHTSVLLGKYKIRGPVSGSTIFVINKDILILNDKHVSHISVVLHIHVCVHGCVDFSR